jgi:hypothetical protein
VAMVLLERPRSGSSAFAQEFAPRPVVPRKYDKLGRGINFPSLL